VGGALGTQRRQAPKSHSVLLHLTTPIEDFGKPEEVSEMAKPIRTAQNRYEATIILKEIAAKGPLTKKITMT
jgi:hypothetical protein